MTEIPLEPDKLEDKAFELIREAIGKGIHYKEPKSFFNSQADELPSQKKIQIRSDEVVWVCAPARLDWETTSRAFHQN